MLVSHHQHHTHLMSLGVTKCHDNNFNSWSVNWHNFFIVYLFLCSSTTTCLCVDTCPYHILSCCSAGNPPVISCWELSRGHLWGMRMQSSRFMLSFKPLSCLTHRGKQSSLAQHVNKRCELWKRSEYWRIILSPHLCSIVFSGLVVFIQKGSQYSSRAKVWSLK